jgi:hypothetical protein
VGQAEDYTRRVTRTLIEEDTGSGWTIVPSPNVSTIEALAATPVASVLEGVACASPTHCFAVGSYFVSASHPKTLIEETTGSGWTIVPSPNPSDWGGTGRLSSVACASGTHCIAVGFYQKGGTQKTLIEENFGGSWTIVSSPNSSNIDNTLSRVACAGAGRCIAIGYSGGGKPLIEENTGSGWTIVSVPIIGGLSDVTCPSPTYCVAVGFSGSIFAADPLIVENTGSDWTVVPAGRAGTLQGLTCTSRTYCLAVGNVPGGDTLVEEYSGRGWEIFHGSPNSSLERDLLLMSVACSGATHCVIVGVQFLAPGTGIGETLIEESTGRGWVIVSSPNVTAGMTA